MDFFDTYGIWTLIFLAMFPRLTLLIGTLAFGVFGFGGVLWWLGWVFTPHLLVAFLSLPYWETNPVLVTIAWIIGILGTFGESKINYER